MSGDSERWTLPVVALLVTIWAKTLVVWLVRWHPWITLAGAATAGALWRWSPAQVAVLWVATLGALVSWHWSYPVSFERWVRCRMRTAWRFELIYRWRWHRAMTLFGLAATVTDPETVPGRSPSRTDHRPSLVWVRCGPWADRLLVRHRLGHEQAHWEIRTEALAQSFRALGCKVTPSRPGFLWLTFRTKETLAATVTPSPARPADQISLDAVHVGVTEDGEVWRLRLAGTHVLIGGATDSGKSSLIWAVLHDIAPQVAAGVFEVRAIDPKGGMELIAGEPMYRHYAYPDLVGDEVTPDSLVGMVQLLEDAALLVQQRAARLRLAGVRKHTPTVAEPAVILIVDELAYLTSYMPEPALRKRAMLALGVILSQGRAVAVTVIGAIQDVRKEAIPLRDLFPTRVAMRLTEAAHSDLILGEGAYKSGAVCDRIPERLPGVGYVRIDGHPTPLRVRSTYLDDNDIARLAARYPAPDPVLEVVESDSEGDDGVEGVAA